MAVETIWLISIAIDAYDNAVPIAARRSVESAKHRCDEHRKLSNGDDYSLEPIEWNEYKDGEVTGTAVISYLIKGKVHKTTQLYIIEEVSLED